MKGVAFKTLNYYIEMNQTKVYSELSHFQRCPGGEEGSGILLRVPITANIYPPSLHFKFIITLRTTLFRSLLPLFILFDTCYPCIINYFPDSPV